MLFNPFTPSEIASGPDDFFGRHEELRTLERSLLQGSVAIDGPTGIGKSSLLAHGLLLMEGFATEHSASALTAVADKGIRTIDEAACLILEGLVSVDQVQNKIRFKLGGFEVESTEMSAYFRDGRHLAALKRVIEKDYVEQLTSGREMLILAIDEADKAPTALAQLIRSLVTHLQQAGVRNVRFVVAGVRPFFQAMVSEDAGIARFFYKTITLKSMTRVDAHDLVETKLIQVVSHADAAGTPLQIEDSVIERIVALSGGHPHILQLLGSHLVEHEDENPDGILDSKDLLSSFRRVCYEDRAAVYEALLHNLEVNGKLDALRGLLGLTSESPEGIVSRSFPTKVERRLSLEVCDKTSMQWFVEHNILVPTSKRKYALVDEFLRVRLILDQSALGVTDVEEELLESAMIPIEAPLHELELEEQETTSRADIDDLFDEDLALEYDDEEDDQGSPPR